MSDRRDDGLLLVPMPTKVERTGGWARVPDGPGEGVVAAREELRRGLVDPLTPVLPWVAERITGSWCVDGGPSAGGSVEGSAYTLRVVRDAEGLARAEISASGPGGIRSGRATLAQVLACGREGDEGGGGGRSWLIPTLEVRDAPAFATRGVMLDISRDRVPTMAHLMDVLDLLAGLKFNHLQLYTEHTFAYVGHEAVWAGCSPMTPAEMIRLDAEARARGIELAANQNCFGHLRSWLEKPAYAGLAETHGDWMFDVWPRSGPFSLCPVDPGSLRLVEDLLGQLLPCVGGNLVNIGCDETFDVGFGRSKGEVERRGRAAVYLEFVERICGVVRQLGKRPMFWADIALSHPEAVERIPEDLVALAWGYEPDSPFDRWCELLARAGREAWVCPGTSTWRAITGRSSERRGNLFGAAHAGRAHGATGFLVCDWGDTGHQQVWPITAYALAEAAQAAWNPSEMMDPRAGALHALGQGIGGPGDAGAGALGPWLEAFGDADLQVRERAGGLARSDMTRLRNSTAIFVDMHKAWDAPTSEPGVEIWRATRDRLAGMRDGLATVARGVGPLVAEEVRHAADVALLAADRGVARRCGSDGTAHARTRQALAERFRAIEAEHRRLWLVRARPGGLEHSAGLYGQIAASTGPVAGAATVAGGGAGGGA